MERPIGIIGCITLIFLTCFPHVANGTTCYSQVISGTTVTTGELGCGKKVSCLWYPETSECREQPFCNSTWSEAICGKVKYSGSCIFSGGLCQKRQPPLSLVHQGLNCWSACKKSETGDYLFNEQCDFCGTQGMCCDINNPEGCIPLTPTLAEPDLCNSASFSYCCAPPGPPTRTPTSLAPTFMPTTLCRAFLNERNCGKAAVSGCIWHGGYDGCQESGYCNSSWSQTVCEKPLNFGSCVFESGQCRVRNTPLGTVNEGYICYDPLLQASNNNPCTGGNQPCPGFCGSEGICCNATNPVNCRPNLAVCTPGKACCAPAGTGGPSVSPTFKPSTSPTLLPSHAPSLTPSSSPTLPAPTSSPVIMPTRSPTQFGSVVELVSTTGQFESGVHDSQDFNDFLCDIFTRYWFPTESGCDRSRINIQITQHGSGRRRRLDTTFDPDIDVAFDTIGVPENSSAIAMGHPDSNKELRRRSASVLFKIQLTDTSSVITDPPSSISDGASSLNGLSGSAYMYIGIGVGLFGLFLLLAVLLLVRHKRNTRNEEDQMTTGYTSRTSLGYPPSESYRRKDMYIPQRSRDVMVVHGSDFRTVPPMSKDYVAEESGNVFVVSSHDVPYASSQAKSGNEDVVAHAPVPPPKPPKAISRTLSQKSYKSDYDDRRSMPRHDSRRSYTSNRSAADELDGMEYRSREDTLRYQMAPYFSGRSSVADDEMESLPTQAQRSFRNSPSSLSSDAPSTVGNPVPRRPTEKELMVQENVGKMACQIGFDHDSIFLLLVAFAGRF